MELTNILISIGVASFYSFTFYLKTKAGDPEEVFDKYKFTATLVVGAGIGLTYELAGVDFTRSKIESQLVMYAGGIAMVESLIKVVWRKHLKQYFKDSDSSNQN